MTDKIIEALRQADDLAISDEVDCYDVLLYINYLRKTCQLCIQNFMPMCEEVRKETEKEPSRPTLGQTVYCVYGDGILAQPVFALTANSFLLNPYGTCEDSWEWYFEDYEETWFTNFAEAKKKLLDNYRTDYPNARFKVVKVSDEYYELKEVENENI